MTDGQGEQAASKVTDRLRTAEWDRDWGEVFEKSMSRRLLMREYLRRSALWAQTYSAESVWPFFDITEYMDPKFKLSPDTERELEEFLRARTSGDVKVTCRGAVRLAELRSHNPTIVANNLPDLYEPLILLYERGGEFITDNAGALDLTGVSLRPGSLQSNASNTPVVALHGIVLDALDVEGRVKFYAYDSDRGPVFRRLLPQGGGQRDEVFSGHLGWQPTTQLSASENDMDCVRIYDQDAARIIEGAVLGVPRVAGQE
ncbi:hypothetical protein ACIQPT_25560 [Streptomyces sp. NPDC091289]|uniref:hypothetical protein n=1 Tax=Streptomyces sp. NPDC091289 TaxID=3365989 RepID=UPI003828D4EE